MILVLDVICRMDNKCTIQISDINHTLFCGTIVTCKEKTDLHRLIVDQLIPYENKLKITVMN